MAFRDSLRLEEIYFKQLYAQISTLKNWKATEEDGKTADIIDSCIQADSAILLLYKNLGEEWNEQTALIQEEKQHLQELKTEVESFKGEINDKVDEINNYLMSLVRALEERVAALEERMTQAEQRLDAAEDRIQDCEDDLAALIRNKVLDLVDENNTYHIEENGQTVSFANVVDMISGPHMVILTGMLNGETTYLIPREYDLDLSTGLVEWATIGTVNETIHEVTVTMLPDDSVNVSTTVFDIGTIYSNISDINSDIEDLQNAVAALTGSTYNLVVYDNSGTNELQHDGTTVGFAEIEAAYTNGQVPVVDWNGRTLVLTDYNAPDETAQTEGFISFGIVYYDGALKRAYITIYSGSTADVYTDNVTIPTGGGSGGNADIIWQGGMTQQTDSGVIYAGFGLPGNNRIVTGANNYTISAEKVLSADVMSVSMNGTRTNNAQYAGEFSGHLVIANKIQVIKTSDNTNLAFIDFPDTQYVITKKQGTGTTYTIGSASTTATKYRNVKGMLQAILDKYGLTTADVTCYYATQQCFFQMTGDDLPQSFSDFDSFSWRKTVNYYTQS